MTKATTSRRQPFTLERIHQNCVDDEGCLTWGGAVNSGGYGIFFTTLANGSLYCVTTGRAVAGLKRGMSADDLKAAKSFRGWPTCGNPLCCRHVMGGTVLQHRGWLRDQGRTVMSPQHRAAITKARRAARNVKGSMELAESIRVMRACGITRDRVAAIVGMNKDMVTRICSGENWAEAVPNASVFTLRA